MATTITQSFKDYASNLEITDRQESLVATTQKNVVDAIGNEISLHPDSKSQLIGSYDRNTLTRYLSEGDVDVMVVMHHGDNENWNTPSGTIACLNKFREILDGAYPDTTKRRDENCITVQFSAFRLDVVPAFKNTAGYYTIPDTSKSAWIQTNPIEFAKAITTVNTQMDGRFIPLIKMVKGWNRQVGWPIKSFHLECMMYTHYKNYTQGYTYPSMLQVFFDKLPTYLNNYCYEPIRGERVDSYMVGDDLILAINKATRAAEKFKKATDYVGSYPNTPKYAIDEWKKLLGDFFPTYG